MLAAVRTRFAAAAKQRVNTAPVVEGTVRNFGRGGIGFIQSAEYPNDDIFAHQSEIKMDGFRALAEGQRVAFEVEDRAAPGSEKKRLKALNIVTPGLDECIPKGWVREMRRRMLEQPA